MGALATECKRLARTKKMQGAPASSFPQLGQWLGVHDPTEDVRPALRTLLQDLRQAEDEEQGDGPRLAEPSMILYGLTSRSEHKGIGYRQNRAARLRGVSASTMHRHEAMMAEELFFLLLLTAAKRGITVKPIDT